MLNKFGGERELLNVVISCFLVYFEKKIVLVEVEDILNGYGRSESGGKRNKEASYFCEILNYEGKE